MAFSKCIWLRIPFPCETATNITENNFKTVAEVLKKSSSPPTSAFTHQIPFCWTFLQSVEFQDQMLIRWHCVFSRSRAEVAHLRGQTKADVPEAPGTRVLWHSLGRWDIKWPFEVKTNVLGVIQAQRNITLHQKASSWMGQTRQEKCEKCEWHPACLFWVYVFKHFLWVSIELPCLQNILFFS